MAGKYDFPKMKKKLSEYLDAERYEHTMGVMYTSGALAMRYGADLEDALAAGLLHDCAKCIPGKKKIRLCEEHHIEMTPFEKEHPFLLHAKLGAYIAEKKYGIRNPEILSAITFHTTGKPGMTLLESIVYVADYIEPMRDKAPRLAEIRQMAFTDLDRCVYMIMGDILQYLNEDPKNIDGATEQAYQYYYGKYEAGQEET